MISDHFWTVLLLYLIHCSTGHIAESTATVNPTPTIDELLAGVWMNGVIMDDHAPSIKFSCQWI